jgi:hypothetical protein
MWSFLTTLHFKEEKMKRENFICFSYAGHTWMWPVEGKKDDWYFSLPACSSEEDQGLVLSEDDVLIADDSLLFFKDGFIAEYEFIKKENKKIS